MEEVKRIRVDMFVLKRMLQEKGTFSAAEFSSSRQRFVQSIQKSMQTTPASSSTAAVDDADKGKLLH